jgi:hypothetical protein
MELISLSHFVSTLFLCGMIWVVHIVHYPSFNFVNENNWPAFHNFHTKRMTLVVVIPMTIELLSSCFLLYRQQNQMTFYYAFSAIAIWLLTAFLYVPIHQRLESDIKSRQKFINLLNASHWPRFLLWTVKACILIREASLASVHL